MLALGFLDLRLFASTFSVPCVPWKAPFAGEVVRRYCVSAGVVAAFAFSCLGFGTRIAGFVRLPARTPALAVIELFAGFGTAALAALGLGLAGLWFPSLLVVAAGCGLLMLPQGGVRSLPAGAARSLAAVTAVVREKPWLAAVAPILAVSLAGALVPETSFDPLRCYLYLPSVFERAHRVHLIEHYGFSAYPMNVGMIYGMLMQAGGEQAAKLFNWSLLCLAAPLMCALAGSAAAGGTAWAALLCVPSVLVFASSGFADVMVTCLLACALVLPLSAGRSRAAALFSGLLLGFALGTKYTAVQAAVPMALVWLVCARRDRGLARAMYSGGVFLLLGALAGWAPWLARNWLMAGNPVHPLFSAWFRGVDVAVSFLSAPSLAPGVEREGLSILNPWRWFLMRENHLWYVLGPLPLALMPLLAFAPPGRDAASRRARVLAGFAVAYAACWAASTLLLRGYLVPAFPSWLVAAVLAFGALKPVRIRALAAGVLAGAGVLGQFTGIYMTMTM